MGAEVVSYKETHLDSKKVSEYTKGSSFKELKPIIRNPRPKYQYESTFLVEETIPLSSNKGGQAAGRNQKVSKSRLVFVYVDQWLTQSGGSSASTRTWYNFSLFSCGTSPCQDAEKKAGEEAVHANGPGRELSTGTYGHGLEISAVFYGDANGDRLNDILIKFSDGTGLLLTTIGKKGQAN